MNHRQKKTQPKFYSRITASVWYEGFILTSN